MVGDVRGTAQLGNDAPQTSRHINQSIQTTLEKIVLEKECCIGGQRDAACQVIRSIVLPKSVLYLAAEFPTHWQTYILDEAEHLRHRGMRVVLATTRAPADEAKSPSLADRAGDDIESLFPVSWRDICWLLRKFSRVAGALSYISETTSGGFMGQVRRLTLVPSAARMARLTSKYKITHVHVHSFGNAAHVAAMTHRMVGLSYSLTLHGSLSVWGGDIRAKTRDAAKVFAVTQPLATELARTYPGENIQIASMGINVSRFTPNRAIENDSATFNVVTVARLHHSKGHVYALEAIRKLSDCGVPVRYTIVGSGPHEAAIRGHIERLGLSDIIEMAGPKSSSEVAAILSKSDTLVLSSIGEGEAAPVSVMEAMASGLPVVCSQIGGTHDMVQDGEDGYLVPQGDVDAIAGALSRLANDPVLREGMGRKARRKAETMFDRKAVSEIVFRTLSEINLKRMEWPRAAE